MALFKDIGTWLFGKGLPLVGSVLLGDVGEEAGKGVAKLLGLGEDSTPDKIMEELQKNPDALIKLREMEVGLKMAQLEKEKKGIEEAGKNIRVEALGDEYTRHTRPSILRKMFYLMTFCVVVSILYIVFAKPASVAIAGPILVDLTMWVGGFVMTGFTGYTISRSSEKKKMMNPGQETVLGKIIAALKKK